jgi:hypothetical protein
VWGRWGVANGGLRSCQWVDASPGGPAALRARDLAPRVVERGVVSFGAGTAASWPESRVSSALPDSGLGARTSAASASSKVRFSFILVSLRCCFCRPTTMDYITSHSFGKGDHSHAVQLSRQTGG